MVDVALTCGFICGVCPGESTGIARCDSRSLKLVCSPCIPTLVMDYRSNLRQHSICPLAVPTSTLQFVNVSFQQRIVRLCVPPRLSFEIRQSKTLGKFQAMVWSKLHASGLTTSVA